MEYFARMAEENTRRNHAAQVRFEELFDSEVVE
jgi:hypothetical protein